MINIFLGEPYYKYFNFNMFKIIYIKFLYKYYQTNKKLMFELYQ